MVLAEKKKVVNQAAVFKDLVRNKNFLILWGNQIIQQFTFGILNFALVLLVYNLSRSNLAVALVFFSIASPVFLFGMFAGVVADVMDRKKIIMFANLGMALAISLLSIAKSELFLILMVAFLISSINQLFLPSESASIPMIVQKDELVNANSLFTISLFASQITGLVLSGPLVFTLGFNMLFILLTLFLFMAFLLVQFLPPLRPLEKKTGFSFGQLNDVLFIVFRTALEKISIGLKFIALRKKVALSLLSLGLMEGLLAMLAVLSIGYIRETLATDPSLLGMVLVPPAGLGFVSSAILVANLSRIVRKEKLVIVGILGMGVTLLLLSFLPRLILLFANKIGAIISISGLGFFVGSFAVMVTVSSRTLIQENTPVAMLGRVFSVLAILTALGASLPILLASSLADVFGVEMVMGIVGVLIIFIGLLIGRGINQDNED